MRDWELTTYGVYSMDCLSIFLSQGNSACIVVDTTTDVCLMNLFIEIPNTLIFTLLECGHTI